MTKKREDYLDKFSIHEDAVQEQVMLSCNFDMSSCHWRASIEGNNVRTVVTKAHDHYGECHA